MAERVARVAEPDEIPTIEQVYTLTTESAPTQTTDPFAKSGEGIKSIQNLSPNFKRSVTNKIQKFQRNVDHDAQSERIDDLLTVTGYDAFGVVQPPNSLESLSEIYQDSEVHYAAINAKVSNIVGLGYKLIETSKTKRALDQITDEVKAKRVLQRTDMAREDLEDQLENLNEEESFTEILIKMWRDYEATGNGYLEIGRKADGTIGYLGHIPSKTIRVRRQRDGFVQLVANKAKFFLNFGDKVTKNPISNESPNEILHIIKYSPAGGEFYGSPDIIAARAAVAGNELATAYNLDYFKNKAVPRHLITLKGANLGVNAQADLLAFFETGLKGQNHRSLFIPLPGDDAINKVEFKIEPIEANIQDSSFNNYRKDNKTAILMAHRVPITKISVSDNVALALAKDADKTFKEQVCQPEQKILQKKLNRIIKEFGDAFELQLNEMTLTDADTQSKIDERQVKAGIWLPNEPRLRDGMPAIKGGDERVDLNAKDKIAQQQAEQTTTRQRDAARSAASPDTSGDARQPKGDGRVTG